MSTISAASRIAGVARDVLLPGRGLFQLTHFVTSACDARCAHCFYRVNAPSRELSLDEIGRVAQSLGALRFLLISGGEPFLRNDLPEIVERYFRLTSCANVSIPTNGLRTAKILPAVRRICGISPALSVGLSVSLDGFGDLHDRLRGVPGVYNAALRTLRGAKGLQAEFPNLSVGVISTLTGENQGELECFAEFVFTEFRPDSHTLNLWRGAGPGARPAGVSPETYLALNRKLSALYAGAGERSGLFTARGLKRRVRDAMNVQRIRYIERVWREERFIMDCHAGEREAVLAEDGRVFPCELMFDRPLGNVRDFDCDLTRLLRGAAAREFVAWRCDKKCFCTHECNTRTLLLLHRPSLLRALFLGGC
jgi:MoaA/NifB/PqqE/SkfB family radical SAM enzyme